MKILIDEFRSIDSRHKMLVFKDGKTVFETYKGDMENVVFPEGVTSIPGEAFMGDKTIKSISFPSTLKQICDRAFEGCENLKSVVFPENLAEIGTTAFYGCSSLEEVVFPENLSRISAYSFYKCPNLRSITFNCDLEYPDSIDLIFEKRKETRELTIRVPYKFNALEDVIGLGFVQYGNFSK